MSSRSPSFTSSVTNRLSGPVGVISAARAELITSATEISSHFPNGWTVRAASAGSRSEPRADVEILHRDQRLMRIDVSSYGIHIKPALNGLGQDRMDKIVQALAKAIDAHLEAKAARDASRVTPELEAAIDGLDAMPEKTWQMAMAGKPEAVIRDAFSLGPGYTESIKPFMDEGDILVVKKGSRSMPAPVVESWWVMRDGRLDQIEEAEVRRLAEEAASNPEP